MDRPTLPTVTPTAPDLTTAPPDQAPGLPPAPDPTTAPPDQSPGLPPVPDPAAPVAARHPVLLPGLRRLWRDRTTLQLGRPPQRAFVLAGVDEPVRATLALLDGTRDATSLQAEAGRLGCPPQRTAQLVELLDGAGLLVDAGRPPPVLSALPREERDRLAPDVLSLGLVAGPAVGAALGRRSLARLQVVGAGRVGVLVAQALAAAGVGHVDVVDERPARPSDVGAGGLRPDDVGRSRGEAARDRVRAVAPSTCTEPLEEPDLVVLAPVRGLDDALVADVVRRRLPHLVTEVRGEIGVVGPLVLPGTTACLHCLDLRRTELDPGWPWLAAQLSAPPPGTPPCDGALALQVAGQAAAQVLSLLDEVAAPASADGTLEMALPDYRWRRRSWAPHVACPCGAASAS